MIFFRKKDKLHQTIALPNGEWAVYGVGQNIMHMLWYGYAFNWHDGSSIRPNVKRRIVYAENQDSLADLIRALSNKIELGEWEYEN